MASKLDEVEWKLDCLNSRFDALVADDDNEANRERFIRAQNPNASEAEIAEFVKKAREKAAGPKSGFALKSKALKLR